MRLKMRWSRNNILVEYVLVYIELTGIQSINISKIANILVFTFSKLRIMDIKKTAGSEKEKT
jgi:hypothetical protein